MLAASGSPPQPSPASRRRSAGPPQLKANRFASGRTTGNRCGCGLRPGSSCPPAGSRRAILHLDDRGRHRLLYRHGPLARAIGFLARETSSLAVLTVDLRGWGDSTPAMYPYEMASWGGLDRYVAYATAALGDSIMGMRTRDALAALAYLRSRPQVDGASIVVSGCGLGGVAALFVAAIDGAVAGVATWDSLVSFRALLAEEDYTWPADAFIPNVLRHFDLPELAASLPWPVRLITPRDGGSRPVVAGADALTGAAADLDVVICESNADEAIVAALRALSGGQAET